MLTPDHASSSQCDWTSARCARLLRHITVSLNALRRLNASTHSSIKSKANSTGGKALNQGPNGDLEIDSAVSVSFQHRVTLDPDWIPQQHQHTFGKNISKKYSRYGAQPKIPPVAEADTSVQFETPQLKKLAEPQMDLTPSWTPNIGDLHGSEAATSKRSEISSKSQDPHDSQYIKLNRGMRELLRATDIDNSNSTPSGCPSLMSMCLRRVPELIKLEEDAQKSTAKTDQTDVTASVLEYLEATHGTLSRGGWKHLRTVVREHGIQMLIDAMHEDIVSASDLHSLAFDLLRNVRSVSDQRQARRDGSNLLRAAALKRSLCSTHLSSAGGDLSNLILFTRNWNASERRGFRYNMMTRMLTDGTLKIEDVLSSSAHSIWKSAFLGLHHKDDTASSALLFIRTIILAACGLYRQETPDTRINQYFKQALVSVRKALTTILTTLTAFVLHAQDSSTQVSSERRKLVADRSQWILLSATSQLMRHQVIASENDLRMLKRSLAINTRILADTTFLCLAAHSGGVSNVSDLHLRRLLCLGRGMDASDTIMTQTHRQVRLSKHVSRAFGRMRGISIDDSLRDFADRLSAREAYSLGSSAVNGHIHNLVRALLAPSDDDSVSMSRLSSGKVKAKPGTQLQGLDASQRYRRHVGERSIADTLWEEAELELHEAEYEDGISDAASCVSDSESSLGSEQQQEEPMADIESPELLTRFESNIDSPDPLFSAKRPAPQQRDRHALSTRPRVAALGDGDWMAILPLVHPFTDQTLDEPCKVAQIRLRDEGAIVSSKRGFDECPDETEWSFISTSSDSSAVDGCKRRRLDNKRRSKSLFSSLSKRGDGRLQVFDGFSDMDELSFMEC